MNDALRAALLNLHIGFTDADLELLQHWITERAAADAETEASLLSWNQASFQRDIGETTELESKLAEMMASRDEIAAERKKLTMQHQAAKEDAAAAVARVGLREARLARLEGQLKKQSEAVISAAAASEAAAAELQQMLPGADGCAGYFAHLIKTLMAGKY